MIERVADPIDLTDEESEEWQARSESMAEKDPEHRERFFPIPTQKPFIRTLRVDLDGRLWVSRHTSPTYVEYSPEERTRREDEGLPTFHWRDRLTWDVLDDDGILLGSVTFPDQTSFLAAQGMDVWGVQEGEYGEDYVVRWRIEPAS